MSKPPRIINDQKKVIHILQQMLGLSDTAYRNMLKDNYNVETCLDLSEPQARELIVKMRAQLNGPRPKLKFDELANRPGMATPPQLRKIDAIWHSVSRAPAKEKQQALEKFLRNRLAINGMRWVEQRDVQRVLAALGAMQKNQKKERACKHCGCVESRACMTPMGPCSWVTKDECSACVPMAAAVAVPGRGAP